VIVLDTTVLVYAVGDPHPLARPARDVIAAIQGGRVRATTTVEAVQEFAHVRARRRGRADAAALARDFAALLAPLLSPDEGDLAGGLEIFEEGPLGAFDAVLAAAARGRGADALVSADRAFAAVTGIRFVPLDGAELAELIG
jgi:predicted nucleic acid-binding protein